MRKRILVALTFLGLAVAPVFATETSSADCCQPGAACCDGGGCPMCKHAK